MDYLHRPEGRIAYELAGPDGAPLVVCVHGMGELRSAYRFTVPALVAAGYRVASFDLRGHGDSDASFDRLDDVATASDLAALVEQLGGPATIVGNSMGAAAAVIAAADRPDLVRGLVLIGPFVRDAPTSAVARFATKAVMRLALYRPWGPAAWLAYYSKLFPGRRPADFDEHRSRVAASIRRPAYWKAFTRLVGQLTHAPAQARLDDVKQPVLVVMGTRDRDFKDPAAEAAYVVQRLGGESLLVEGAGHYPMTQYPDVVNPALVAFMRRVAPPAPSVPAVPGA